MLGYSHKLTSDLQLDATLGSFRIAANEAAISRLYGGIHFRDAVENGQQQGFAISAKIISQIRKAGIGRIEL